MIPRWHEDNSRRPSDVNEHLNTDYKYASQCESVIEYSAQPFSGTLTSLAAGLLNNGSTVKKLYYVNPGQFNVAELAQACCTEGVTLKLYQQKTHLHKLEAPVDMACIRGWHCYKQVLLELENLVDTKKYILLHDSKIDEFVSESVRCGANCKALAVQNDWKLTDVQRGIWPAIEKFVEDHKEWVITVLERIATSPVPSTDNSSC